MLPLFYRTMQQSRNMSKSSPPMNDNTMYNTIFGDLQRQQVWQLLSLI